MKILKSKRIWVAISMVTAFVLNNSETINLTKEQIGYLGIAGFAVTVILQLWFNQDKKSSV